MQGYYGDRPGPGIWMHVSASWFKAEIHIPAGWFKARACFEECLPAVLIPHLLIRHLHLMSVGRGHASLDPFSFISPPILPTYESCLLQAGSVMCRETCHLTRSDITTLKPSCDSASFNMHVPDHRATNYMDICVIASSVRKQDI